MKEFYKDKVACVYYDPELDTLFLEYFGKVANDEQFIFINTVVLNAFLSLNTQNFVADIRKMSMLTMNSQKWVVEVLLPGMLKHLNGKMLYHAQFIDKTEVMSKVSGTNIKTKSKQLTEGFEVVQFSDRGELETYLKSR